MPLGPKAARWLLTAACLLAGLAAARSAAARDGPQPRLPDGE